MGGFERTLSRLVEEFVARAGLPYVFYTASGRSTGEEMRMFTEEVAGSNLPGAAVFRVARIQTSWTSWRGRAIEPLLREALDRVLVEVPLLEEGVVGGYWTRTNDPEIDIVIADRQPVAKAILAVGSIKWLEQVPFGRRDLARLLMHRPQLPGATGDTPLVVVARAGCDVDGVTTFGAEDLLKAWPCQPL